MIIFMKIMQGWDVENIKVQAVNKKHSETLSEFIQRVRREKGYSLDMVQQRSGGTINASYVSRIENGQVLAESITPKKLRALASGLGVSLEQIESLARGKPLDEKESFNGEFAVLYKGFHDLSPEDQAEMRAMVRMLATEVERRRPRNPPAGGKGKK